MKLSVSGLFVESVLYAHDHANRLFFPSWPSPSVFHFADQLTINEYPPGIGIAPHVDTHTGCIVCVCCMRVTSTCISPLRHEIPQRFPVCVGVCVCVWILACVLVCAWVCPLTCTCTCIYVNARIHVGACTSKRTQAHTLFHMAAFEDGIACVSLGSDIVLDFRHPQRQTDFHAARWTPRRSLLVMTGGC